jgi:glycosyltransferase involved in cell wall biosynthesis
MHILYLHQYFTTPQTGGGTRSYSFAKHLTDKGHKITMVTSNAYIKDLNIFENNRLIEKVSYENIDVVAINVPYSQKMSYFERVLSFLKFMMISSYFVLRENSYDVVFATSTPLTIGIPGLVAKLRHRIPFIFEVRDLWPEYPENFGIIKNYMLIKILEKFSKLLYENANKVIGISNSMLRRIEKKYDIDSKKLVELPIGADLERVDKINSELINRIKLKYQLDKKFIIGHAGAIGFVNHLENVIKLAKVFKKEKDIILLIVGDGKERKRLENEIKRENLNNVYFLGKFNAYETFSIINMFDVCLFSILEYDKNGNPTLNSEDALSNKFFDYLAAGKPILMTARGEITDLMDKFKFGFYLDMNDNKKIYELIHQLKCDSILRKKMGHNSKQLAEGIFDRKKICKKLEKIFNEIITQK